MEKIDLSKHIGITSHESPEQAKNNDRIINVTWFIGKRCNFDCSYCSDFVHDNYSPHVKKEDILNFIDNLDTKCQEMNKKFKIVFTGGEPFVHPNFVEVLEYCSKKSQVYQLGVVTNGSLPLKLYNHSMNFLNFLTISVHLERPRTETEDLINKIIELNSTETCFLNINIMALPGRFDILNTIASQLKKENIKFIIKKINPPDIENYKEHYVQKDKNDIHYESTDDYLTNKKTWHKKLKNNLEERYKEYYSEKELEFLNFFENQYNWPNMKLHFENNSILVNNSELITKNLNKWMGWICFVGLNSLYIEYDGSVYRGVCMEGGKIGKINDKCVWPKEPVICTQKVCICSPDMCTKKVKDIKYLGLVN